MRVMSKEAYRDGYRSDEDYVASRRGVWYGARWQLLLAILAPVGVVLIVWLSR